MGAEVLEDLKKAILQYNSELAVSSAKKVVEQKLDPLKALDVMAEAIRQVGDGYGKGELWLPDLVGAGETMSDAMPIIEEEIKKRGMKRKSLGTVVIGTVYGDIHSIGKTMVASLLAAEGFDVHDLGINVKPETYIAAVREYKADLLGLSALLTVTASEQKNIIQALRKEGLLDKVKVMVGGGAITQEFADSIGADGYDPTAPGAVKLARSLVGK
jgi:methylmalonyl-CoA mutase cobalamin-binding domain/chain